MRQLSLARRRLTQGKTFEAVRKLQRIAGDVFQRQRFSDFVTYHDQLATSAEPFIPNSLLMSLFAITIEHPFGAALIGRILGCGHHGERVEFGRQSSSKDMRSLQPKCESYDERLRPSLRIAASEQYDAVRKVEWAQA
jgi:hypothetical protein